MYIVTGASVDHWCNQLQLLMHRVCRHWGSMSQGCLFHYHGNLRSGATYKELYMSDKKVAIHTDNCSLKNLEICISIHVLKVGIFIELTVAFYSWKGIVFSPCLFVC